MDDEVPHPKSAAGALDPSDWDAFERTAHEVLSGALAKLRGAADGPVWQATPAHLLAGLNQPLPEVGAGIDAIANQLASVLPYGVGNTHPRFFGWVHGAGSPGNLLADIAAAAMNANCGGRDHAAIHVERQVIGWCREMFSFPERASGLLVSGTSMATIIAAKVARDAVLGFASRASGVHEKGLVGYVSTEAHSCLDRAFDMLGLGTNALRKIKVGPNFQMDLEALARQIRVDREAGFTPFFLAGTAGTVNTAAIDDLNGLAAIAHAEHLWFHVDGAFGASAILSEAVRPRLNGLDRADSLAFDFHKWMHVNYDAGCVLIRDGDLHRRAFARRPDYLAAGGEALAGGEPWPVDFGPELSRGNRALKVWAHLLEHGTTAIGEAITANCEQAAYLGRQVEAHPQMDLLAPVSMNICCFRWNERGPTEPQLDALNQSIVTHLQSSGIAAPSTTRIHGRLAIRVNITNHRTQMSDMDVLVQAVEAAADMLK